MTWCLPGVPGHPVWVSRGGHRSGISSVPWSRLPFMPLRYRFSTLLCRSWWNSCQTFSGFSTRSRPFPSRLSQCPRSSSRASLRARFCVLRSWQNSWWKCRRSSPFLSCRCCNRFWSTGSGLWSRTLTFQLLVVLDLVEVLLVFSQDRFLPRLPSRSLKVQFLNNNTHTTTTHTHTTTTHT